MTARPRPVTLKAAIEAAKAAGLDVVESKVLPDGTIILRHRQDERRDEFDTVDWKP